MNALELVIGLLFVGALVYIMIGLIPSQGDDQ
jgi:hypothetical protein